RVAAADAVVHRGVLEVDAREIGWRSLPNGDPLDALLHERQHAERQKVDLYEARVVAGILIPLAHHAVFHGGALERYDLHERPARDGHPAHVLRNVPWQPRDLRGELTQLFPELRATAARSEERRVGKECRSRWWESQGTKKQDIVATS